MAILVRVGRPTAVRKSISLCSAREKRKKENTLFGASYVCVGACARAYACECAFFCAYDRHRPPLQAQKIFF